jgi:putative endonuclease
MAIHNDFGREGEQIAKAYLLKEGYQIIAENYQFSHVEIDLIAYKNNLLVFVEVKSRGTSKYGHPENFVNKDKRKHLKRAARAYLAGSSYRGEVRFDIIAIIKERHLFKELKHFKDAFF